MSRMIPGFPLVRACLGVNDFLPLSELPKNPVLSARELHDMIVSRKKPVKGG
jgi:hypothetical protein